MADEIMTPEETAEYLKVHPQTVYRQLRAGKLPGRKIGDQWRVRRADLDAFLSGQASTSAKAVSGKATGKSSRTSRGKNK